MKRRGDEGIMERFEAVLKAHQVYEKFADEDSKIIYQAKVDYVVSRNETKYLRAVEKTSRWNAWLSKNF